MRKWKSMLAIKAGKNKQKDVLVWHWWEYLNKDMFQNLVLMSSPFRWKEILKFFIQLYYDAKDDKDCDISGKWVKHRKKFELSWMNDFTVVVRKKIHFHKESRWADFCCWVIDIHSLQEESILRWYIYHHLCSTILLIGVMNLVYPFVAHCFTTESFYLDVFCVRVPRVFSMMH